DRAFEAEEQVVMVPSKSRGIEPRSSQRRTRARIQFNCAISMAIYMTVETCHTAAGRRRESMFALVKPTGGELGDQQPQTLHLLRSQNAVEELAKICLGDLAPSRYITQVRTGCQEQRRWKFGKVLIRNIEGDVEPIVLGMLPGPHLRKEHVPRRLQRMCQRSKSFRKEMTFANRL